MTVLSDVSSLRHLNRQQPLTPFRDEYQCQRGIPPVSCLGFLIGTYRGAATPKRTMSAGCWAKDEERSDVFRRNALRRYGG